jgi:hypothetical protein
MKYVYTIILALFTTNAVAAANITARLSHNPVSLDESFHLIYEADTNVDDPDFSVLTKDFEILSSSQSTNMRSVNGQWSLKRSWDLALISRQAGVFTIPPVPFGNDTSPSVRVTVKPSAPNSTQGTSGQDAYFLEVATDRRSAWVQSEIIYTVRFLSSINISRPTLSEPETSDPDAIIEQLGQVTNYQKMINGMPYSVNELRFAVYPQHSGTLIFKPIVFEGRIPGGRRSNSLFDQFMQSGTLKRLRSKSVSVTVKPRPTKIAADQWLPAENLTIEEEWSEDIVQLRTGEPVTRTLTISATGLTAEHLDEIDFADIDGVKQYPDKAVTENQRMQDGITGVKQIKIAMIPTRAGRYIVPEISIPWWNTRSGQQEFATLPETVIEASGLASAPPMSPAIEVVAPQGPGEARTASGPGVATGAGERVVTDSGYWPWISLFLATGWIATTLLYFRNSRAPSTTARPATPVPILPLERAVEKACSRGDAAKTKDCLLEWAAVRWPQRNISSLADIAAAVPVELGSQIDALNKKLYSSHGDGWEPKALLAAFHAFIAAKPGAAKKQQSILEPLYKT